MEMYSKKLLNICRTSAKKDNDNDKTEVNKIFVFTKVKFCFCQISGNVTFYNKKCAPLGFLKKIHLHVL